MAAKYFGRGACQTTGYAVTYKDYQRTEVQEEKTRFSENNSEVEIFERRI